MKAEETVDYHIKTVWYAISRMYNAHAIQADMSMAVGYVLLNIDKNGTPATKIAPQLGLETRSLTRMLRTLDDKGWIRRETDEHDKRVVNIFLTEEGKTKRDFARQGVIEFNSRVYEAIGADRLQCFFEVMQGIQQLVESENSKYPSRPSLPDLT